MRPVGENEAGVLFENRVEMFGQDEIAMIAF